MTADRTTLSGRAFRSIGQHPTMERDVFVMARVREARLDQLPLEANESAEDYALRLLSHLLQSPTVFDLLGGMMLPEEVLDTDWTPKHAREMAAFLKGLTGDEDKEKVQRLLLAVLIPFLESGLASLTRTAASSSPPASGEVASTIH